ncbi:hypothetical protein M6B38_391345 [Iris pallida]|uniref:Uncharacterized protein n=1 Tax=Iris pallida TaxID=29817 RepID=A0AAX6FYJ2_IRIPA|nr:hypothetical protein M6B38_391345 [Iris pallida]
MATAVRCFPSGDGDSDLLFDHGERLSPRRCFSVSPVVLPSRRRQCFRRSPSFPSSSDETVHLRRLGPTSTSSVRLLPVILVHRTSSPSTTLRLLTFSIASSTFTGSRFRPFRSVPPRENRRSPSVEQSISGFDLNVQIGSLVSVDMEF